MWSFRNVDYPQPKLYLLTTAATTGSAILSESWLQRQSSPLYET